MGRWGRRVFPAAVMSAVGLLALLSVSAWLQIQAVRLSYESRRLRGELEALDREEQLLRRRLGEALSLARLDDRARRRRGLSVPRPEQIRLLPDL